MSSEKGDIQGSIHPWDLCPISLLDGNVAYMAMGLT